MRCLGRSWLASGGLGCEGANVGIGMGPVLLFLLVPSLMLASRRIGKDLSNTFAKLEKLTICEFLGSFRDGAVNQRALRNRTP